MRNAFPLWGQRLLISSNPRESKFTRDRKAAHIHGTEAFSKAQAKVTCQEPVDKVRALLPICLNSPVQDAAELRELVEICVAFAIDEGALSEVAKIAMLDAQNLMDGGRS
jgi:hypothetical protein